MATGPGVNQGKPAFLEEFLPDNRDATLVDVNRAWGAAGHDDTISESLFGKIRSRLGLTGKKGTNGGATGEIASKTKGKAKSSPEGAKVKAKGQRWPLRSPTSGRARRGQAGRPSSRRCWAGSRGPT